MLMLKLDCPTFFLEAISLLTRFAENANVECSPDLFSIIASHHNLDLVVAIQMMPEFFTYFFSHKSHLSRILLQPLYDTIKRMQQSNIPLAALFVLRRNDRLILKFSPPGNGMPLVRTMALNETVKEDVGRINLKTFVSIESEVFRHMVAEFRGYIVCVLPTPSSVMFSIEVKELVLDKAKGECIIEGVTEEVQTEFLIPLYPWHIFYNMTFHSKRIWLFKTFDKSTLIIAPVGLYAQYSIFFPLG